MKESKKRRSAASIFDYIIFFVTVAVVVTAAVVIFEASLRGFGGTAAILLTVLVTLVLSGLFTLLDLLRRRISVDRPVAKILEATERISRGDFSTRVYPEHTYERYDDYDLIMDNINTLAEELEHSEILKTDFIASISHEMKTPLAAIQSYAKLLTAKDLSDEARMEYAEALHTASGRLSSLTTNILKLTKLEQSGIIPEAESFSLDGLLSEVIVGHLDSIEKKGIELECELSEIRVRSVPSYLELAFHNLMSNAVKFTDPDGKIRVRLYESDGGAVAEFSDTGCGISPEVGARIFDKFFQADPSRSAEGNGLGLALVKRVIDVLGGDISVSSEPGVGSTFTIRIRTK